MARRAISMTELTEAVYQWHRGRGIRAISRSLGISRNTLKKYLQKVEEAGVRREGPIPEGAELAGILAGASDYGLGAASIGPAQTLLSSYHGRMEGLLKCKDITAKQIWRLLAEEEGVAVSYTSVKRYLRREFSWGESPATIRVETPAGRQAQVDFGSVGKLYDPASGRERKAWVFVMVLSFSRHRFVRFVFDQKVSTWIDCHRRAFEFFGGVPETVVLDNLKSGVVKPDMYDPTMNRSYAECERHYGFLADPAKVRTPRHKGKVERQIRVVRQQVLAGRKFADIDEANRFALHWCRHGIGMDVNGTTRRRPYELFLEQEQTSLKPLPRERFETPVWQECKVHQDQHIVFDRSFYSLPARFVGKQVWVRADERILRIFCQEELVKTHLRASEPGSRQTDDCDLSPEKRPYVNPDPALCRKQAAELGEHVHALVDKLLREHTIKNLRKVQGILRLGAKYGGARLDSACLRAMAYGNHKLKSIRLIIEKGLESPEQCDCAAAAMSEQGQAFIRPGSYYESKVWS